MITQVQDGEDFVLVATDRSNAQSRVEAFRINGNTGVISLKGQAVAGTVSDNLTVAAGKSISYAAGAGGLDAHLATGAFRLGAASATLGFFGAAAVAKAAAYVQTYAVAARTNPAITSNTITDSSTGVASTSTIAAITSAANAGSADIGPTKNAIATLAAELALAKADLLALKKLVNAMIDDDQAYGLAG